MWTMSSQKRKKEIILIAYRVYFQNSEENESCIHVLSCVNTPPSDMLMESLSHQTIKKRATLSQLTCSMNKKEKIIGDY